MSTSPQGPDDVWADLVARLEATDSSSVPDSGSESDPGSDPRAGTGPEPAVEEAEPNPATNQPRFPSLEGPVVGPLAPRGPRDWDESELERAEAALEEDSDFVPETPGPVLAGRPGVVIACIAAVAMPILMLVLLIVAPGRIPGSGWAMMGLTAIVALVYLAWSLPRHRADDGDDGARV
ncbi:hypothetical protein [Galactobacter sp.]|uniref:hypothetical protein n=1 Tax=Galactobacter sp. TaxID=2676125 RepID=UPI0025C0930E|nr:hypothetical protein [Galactobacter sp.]